MASRTQMLCPVTVVMLMFLAIVRAGFRHPPDCEGLTCGETAVMRYNGTCYCQEHPCLGHTCNDRQYPHLEFEYTPTGQLSCFCTLPCPQNLCAGERKPPQCVEAGHHCPLAEQPILHLDDGKCKCKSHPCAVAGRGACTDAAMPMLDYHYDEHGLLDCFCRKHPCPHFKCEQDQNIEWDQEGHCSCHAHHAEL